jgi:hypothetical protein
VSTGNKGGSNNTPLILGCIVLFLVACVVVIAAGIYLAASTPAGPVIIAPQGPGPVIEATLPPRVPGLPTGALQTTPRASGPAAALPEMPVKPKPVQITFQGCPPEGDGSDAVLNRAKNRVDDGNYIPVLFDAVAKLPWPKATERRDHANWSAADSAAISRYEGIPVIVERYITGAREEGPESPNCHGADLEQHDFHIWLTVSSGDNRTESIVVEMTPRVRPKHPGWTVTTLSSVASQRLHVRVSGWVMYDPEHPEQLGQTRGTLWEIRPVMQFEVERSGRWLNLDEFAGQK